jgi:hypothetical protein
VSSLQNVRAHSSKAAEQLADRLTPPDDEQPTVNGVDEMTAKFLSIAAGAALLLATGAANAQSTVSPTNNNNWQLPAAGSGGASADKTVSPTNNNWQLPAAGSGGASADKKQNAATTQKPN